MAATETIIAVFPSRSALTKALDFIMALDDLKVQRAAIVAQAESGTLVVADDISADEGAIAGGTLGALLTALGLVQFGVLSLPAAQVLLVLGLGVLIGGLLGGLIGRFGAGLLDAGFRTQRIDAIGRRLQPGHPALLLELSDDIENLPRLRHELKAYRAQIVTHLRDFLADDTPSQPPEETP